MNGGTEPIDALIHSLWAFHDPAASEARFRRALVELERSGNDAQRVEIITQIARALGLQRKFDDGHALLDEVEATVTSVPTLSAARVRLLLERGRLFNSSNRTNDARPLFERAWAEARQAGLDALAVDAAHMMGIVLTASSPEESLQWNVLALEIAESSDDFFAQKWAPSLHNNIGWTLHDSGRPGEAMPHFNRALEQRETEGDARAVRIARWCVARCLRSLGRIDEALEHQLHLLKGIESGEADADGYVEEEIGECLLELGRSDEARAHFAQAHGLLSTDPWLAEREPARLDRLAVLGAVRTIDSKE